MLRHVIMLLDIKSSCVPSLLEIKMTPQKQVTNVSLILKDSDRASEKLSSLIRLTLPGGQKKDISKEVSFIGI